MAIAYYSAPGAANARTMADMGVVYAPASGAIGPFWMLPLIGIMELKARDIIGYSTLQFVFHVAVVLFLAWAFSYTM